MENKSNFIIYFILAVIILFSDTVVASTAITATARNGQVIQGTASTTTLSLITCIQAIGGGEGGTRCNIQAPGWNGVVSEGESIGTTGPGNVVLGCDGTYAAAGGSLTCIARIDDTTCSPEQTILASSRDGSSFRGLAPIKSAAIVECTQASGSVTGATCGIQGPGYTGQLTPGQSIPTSGAGTVALARGGQYSANGGGLSCSALVSQACP
ncbi:putative membrane protein [Xanthomonas bromi]|uniref:Putative membrane protein n=1 Tax=Xanthomonas bromi TaxID=56449 RepID=A0A1C3NHR5_9XANT|nr:hypothetical protein [Xanthomonas bromi]SBV49908.1 putative membrane protein [Xanthomonas bromi]